MGKIIQLGDHLWELPKEPTSREHVLFVDKKKEDQFWIRDKDFPQIFYDFHRDVKYNAEKTTYNDNTGSMETLSVEDTKIVGHLLDRELYRRVYGVWFMNNGVLTYITGGHYFQLQWGAMPGYKGNPNDGSPCGEYREFQAKFHYFLQMCKTDPNCGGAFIGKPKKTGITNIMSIDYVDESTRYKEKRFGMMSKDAGECKRTNFMYYLHCFDWMPRIFQPETSNRGLTAIKFDILRTKSNKNSISRRLDEEDGYNSEIFIGAGLNPFDGPVMFRGMLDEITKYKAPWPKDVFKANKETVKIGEEINGKLWMFAYSPEEDGKNVEECAEIWKDAGFDTLDPFTKSTKNGIYNYFISVLDSSQTNFDKYGICDRDRTSQIIMHRRSALKNDSDALQAYTRQYPIVAEEMWAAGGVTGSTYNNIRLGIRKSQLTNEKEMIVHGEAGFLDWINPDKVILGGKDRKIESLLTWRALTDEEMMDNKKAPFVFYGRETIDVSTLNVPMKLFLNKETEFLQPVDNSPYGGSWDPTDFVAASDVAMGSKHSGMYGNEFDLAKDSAYGRPVTNIKLFDYYSRHENPLDDLENLIKMVLYWGGPIYIETNKPWMFEMVKNLGLSRFLIIRHSSKGLITWNPKDNYKLTTTTKAIIDDYIVRTKLYLTEPEITEAPDYLMAIQDLELIKQLMKFDPLNTKKYDKAVAFSLWRVLMDSIREAKVLKALKGDDNTYAGLVAAMKALSIS